MCVCVRECVDSESREVLREYCTQHPACAGYCCPVPPSVMGKRSDRIRSRSPTDDATPGTLSDLPPRTNSEASPIISRPSRESERWRWSWSWSWSCSPRLQYTDKQTMAGKHARTHTRTAELLSSKHQINSQYGYRE